MPFSSNVKIAPGTPNTDVADTARIPTQAITPMVFLKVFIVFAFRFWLIYDFSARQSSPVTILRSAIQLECSHPILLFTIIRPDKSRKILKQYHSCQWPSRNSDKEPPSRGEVTQELVAVQEMRRIHVCFSGSYLTQIRIPGHAVSGQLESLLGHGREALQEHMATGQRTTGRRRRRPRDYGTTERGNS